MYDSFSISLYPLSFFLSFGHIDSNSTELYMAWITFGFQSSNRNSSKMPAKKVNESASIKSRKWAKNTDSINGQKATSSGFYSV